MVKEKLKHVDNLIIGGGLAGVYCAWQLQQQKREFQLLEAQNFTGGRIQPASDLIHIDTGATWFWPHQQSIQDLVQKLGLKSIEQYTEGDTLFQQPDSSIQTMSYQQGLSYKLKGGAAELIRKLTSEIATQSIRFNSPVTSVEKNVSGWEVSCKLGKETVCYHSHNIFIAIPPRMVLQHLTPENWLSDNALEYLSHQQTWMSAQAKYVAVFEQPFWRDGGHSGFAISHRGPLAEIHDATTNTGDFALFGFVGVPAIQRATIDPYQLKLACRQQLCQIFELPEPKEDFLQDWAKNSFIANKQDLVEPPRHSQVNLQRLEKDTDLSDCFFVGSEYSQSEPGYMEGAINAVDTALSRLADE